MLKTAFPSFLLYSLLSLFIMGWWTIAFSKVSSQQITLKTSSSSLPCPPSLSILNREELHQALSGDVNLMQMFIQKWEEDARQLESQGVEKIEKLPRLVYQEAIQLAHLIQASTEEELTFLNEQHREKKILDDKGNLIDLSYPFHRFYPQTYAAASFLLALLQTDQMIGIPKGMRLLEQLYPRERTERISTYLDSLTSEKLYLMHPDMIFVSHYSHPPTLKTFQDQKLALYTCPDINFIEEIPQSLVQIGHVINQPLKAKLLSIFIESAMMHIDNRLRALYTFAHSFSLPHQVLLLYYHRQTMIPTTKSFSGQLMQRCLSCHPGLVCPIEKSSYSWKLPFDQEKIRRFKPDYLLIASSSPLNCPKEPFEAKQVFYLDEAIQESPTQYIVLAYFDLFNHLASIYE